MYKYFLSVEIRYSFNVLDSDGEIESNEYVTKKFSSGAFETEKYCRDYGNKLIQDNLWIEQYPGTKGYRLTSQFNLVAPSLKNRAQIFIKVNRVEVLDFESLCTELRKFDVPVITKRI